MTFFWHGRTVCSAIELVLGAEVAVLTCDVCFKPWYDDYLHSLIEAYC